MPYLYYFLFYYIFRKNIYIISSLIAVLIYGWISQNIGYVRGNEFSFYGLLRLGVWRAIAGVCLGSICWLISGWLSRLRLACLGKIMVSFGILFSIFIIVSNTILYPESQQDFVSIVFIAILVTLVFSHQGILYFLYSPKIGKWLRDWSVALFFMAPIGSRVMREINVNSLILKNIVYYVGAICSAGMTMVVLKLLNKYLRKISWKIYSCRNKLIDLKGKGCKLNSAYEYLR